MTHTLPGLSVFLLSIGLSAHTLTTQKSRFQNLHYRATQFNCSVDDLLNPSVSLLDEDDSRRCFIPDLADHNGRNHYSAYHILLEMLDNCEGRLCDDN
jgi:hypothetical protein